MPEMIPVGNTIPQPAPINALGALSGILGVKQQQQNLQTGAYQQQSAAAQAQQQQLAAGQQQGVQDFFKQWDPSQHRGEDGTTDIDSAMQSPQFLNAGNAKPAIMNALLETKQKQLSAKLALSNLNNDLVNQFSRSTGALAKDPDVIADQTDPTTGVNPGRAKVNGFIQNFSALSPDAARVAQIYAPLTQHTPPQHLSSALQALQMVGEDVSGQQSQQNPQQLAVNTGAATQLYNVNRATGLQPGQQPVAAVKNQLGPQQQPGYLQQAAAASASGAGLASGSVGDVNQHYQAVQAEAQKAEMFTGIARNVQDFAHTAITGTPEEKLNLLNGMLAYAGVPKATDLKTASDLLEKNMSQLNLQGNVASDFRSMITQMAQPHMTMSEDAIRQAAGQLIGQAQMKKSIGTAMTPEYNHAIASGDTTLYRAKRDAITNVADPRVWEFASLSPKDRQAFVGRLSPQDRAALGQKVKAAEALGIVQ
jgi:hypothetical protein